MPIDEWESLVLPDMWMGERVGGILENQLPTKQHSWGSPWDFWSMAGQLGNLRSRCLQMLLNYSRFLYYYFVRDFTVCPLATPGSSCRFIDGKWDHIVFLKVHSVPHLSDKHGTYFPTFVECWHSHCPFGLEPASFPTVSLVRLFLP